MTTDLCQISGDIRSNGGDIFVGKTSFNAANINFHKSSPDELYQCLQHLRQTDPLTDIERIRSESHKGVPLTGSYEWILRNAAFEDWEASGSGIFWIRGEPGKGKTMIMVALIDQYSRKKHKRSQDDALPISPTIAHFICESQDQYHNNAISVLRGLLFMILDRRPELLRYLQDAFKRAGPRLFEDGSVDLFQTLRRIFLEILDDDRLGQMCFFLDALDECETGLDLLLDLIVSTAVKSNVRWAVTSRKQENILRKLNPESFKIDLEDNFLHVQKAIDIYIDKKIEALDYGPSTSSTVSEYLKEKSEGTFLWVHLVFKMLVDVPEWDVLTELEQVPPGLDAFYERMFQQVSRRKDAALYYQVLGIVLLTYRPLRLVEVAHALRIPVNLAKFLQDQKSPTESLVKILEKLTSNCGSFLSVREQTVYTVHKSAHDFLRQSKKEDLFTPGESQLHAWIGERCIDLLSTKLKRDILDLRQPGTIVASLASDELLKPEISDIQYAVSFWANHIKESYKGDSGNGMSGNESEIARTLGIAEKFLQIHFLHWLEALSLLGRLSDAFQELDSFASLRHLSKTPAPVEEMLYFLGRYSTVIERAPLQLYLGLPLYYSPQDSLRNQLDSNLWTQINILSEPGSSTSRDCLQVWEQGGKILSLAVSTKLVASAEPGKIRLWDIGRGNCRYILPSSDLSARSIAVHFSVDEEKVFAVDGTGSVCIWNCESGSCETIIQYGPGLELEKPVRHIRSTLTSSGLYSTIPILDTELCQWNVAIATGEKEKIPLDTSYLPDNDLGAYIIQDITPSVDGKHLLALRALVRPGIYNVPKFQLWDTTGRLYRTMWEHQLKCKGVVNAKFVSTPASTHIILTRLDGSVEVWDLSGHDEVLVGSVSTFCWMRIPRVEFLPTLNILITTYQNTKISFYKLDPPTCSSFLQYFQHRGVPIDDMKISPNHQFLASMSTDLSKGTIQLWNLKKCLDEFDCAMESHDSGKDQIRSGQQDSINWARPPEGDLPNRDRATTPPRFGAKYGGQRMKIDELLWSPCGRFIASMRRDDPNSRVQIHSTDTGKLKSALNSECLTIAFFSRGADMTPLLVTATTDFKLQFWDLDIGLCIKTLDICKSSPRVTTKLAASNSTCLERVTIQLSPDSKLLACGLDLCSREDSPIPCLATERDSKLSLRYKSGNIFGITNNNLQHPKLAIKNTWTHMIELYQVSTGVSISTEKPEVKVTSAGYSGPPAIERSIAGRPENPAIIQEFVLERTLEFERANAIRISPDNNFLAITTDSNILRLISNSDSATWIQPAIGFCRVLNAFEFSPDNTKLAIIYQRKELLVGPMVSIVATASGAILQQLLLQGHINLFCSRPRAKPSDLLSFVTTNGTTYLRTDRVLFSIDGDPKSTSQPYTGITNIPSRPLKLDVQKVYIKQCILPDVLGLSVECDWVLFNQERLMWIPHDFRPHSSQSCWLIRRDKIVIESEPGRIVIFKFDLEHLKSLFGSGRR